MIFVATGTQKFQLNRLLVKIDELIEQGVITEDVFAQIGLSEYKPKNYEYADYLSADDFDQKIKECSILITHAGVGTIMRGLNGRKPVIVFPRLSRYGEHIDDHQLEIADSFVELKLVTLCDERDDLGECIQKARVTQYNTYHSKRQNVINVINAFLEDMD